MVKEYFSHDYSSRADQKIKRLIIKHGMLGYGIYWGIIEMLYQNDNMLIYDIDLLSYDFRESGDIIKSIVSDFDLFSIEDGYIYSTGVSKRLQIRDSKSLSGKASANKRWDDGNSHLRQKANKCIFYVIRVFNETESFIKLGITMESVSRRYSGKLKGYEYELIFSHDDDVDNCLELERELSNKFNKYTPNNQFAGYLECYNISDIQDIIVFAMQHFNIPIAKSKVRNAIKEIKEIKGKKRNKGDSVKSFTPPTLDEVVSFFRENGFTEKSGEKAYKYYDVADWVDSKGAKVKNWKQKMHAVWFKDENKEAPAQLDFWERQRQLNEKENERE